MKITDLEPQIVWKYFDEITKVPRPSKKEEKIIAYLEDFAQKNHIAYKKDEVGNITRHSGYGESGNSRFAIACRYGV